MEKGGLQENNLTARPRVARYNVADLLGGYWYSTTEVGWCGYEQGEELAAADPPAIAPPVIDPPPGPPQPSLAAAAAVGDCTWRLVEVVKKVSRQCHDRAIFAAVRPTLHDLCSTIAIHAATHRRPRPLTVHHHPRNSSPR
jgi:hypothetical protein